MICINSRSLYLYDGKNGFVEIANLFAELFAGVINVYSFLYLLEKLCAINIYMCQIFVECVCYKTANEFDKFCKLSAFVAELFFFVQTDHYDIKITVKCSFFLSLRFILDVRSFFIFI